MENVKENESGTCIESLSENQKFILNEWDNLVINHNNLVGYVNEHKKELSRYSKKILKKQLRIYNKYRVVMKKRLVEIGIYI